LNTSKCHRNGRKRYPKWPMLVEINKHVVGSVSGDKVHLGGYINQYCRSYQKDFETNEELSHKQFPDYQITQLPIWSSPSMFFQKFLHLNGRSAA
jgi:hypothetical protein